MEHPYDPKKRKELFLDLAMLKYLESVAADFKGKTIKEIKVQTKEVYIPTGSSDELIPPNVKKRREESTDRFLLQSEGRKKKKMFFDPSIESKYIEKRVREYRQPKEATGKYFVAYYDNLTGDVYDKNVFINARIEIFNFFQQWKNYNSSLLSINDRYFKKEDFLSWLYKIEQEVYGYKIIYNIRDEWNYAANATPQMPSGDPNKSDNFTIQNAFLSSLIKKNLPRSIETIINREGFINNDRTTIDVTTYDSDGVSGVGAYVLSGFVANLAPMNFDLAEISWYLIDEPNFENSITTTYHEIAHVFQSLSKFITDDETSTGISDIRRKHRWFVEAHASFICGEVYRRMSQEMSVGNLSITLGRPPTIQEFKNYIDNFFIEETSKKYFTNSQSGSLQWYSWCGLGLAFLCKRVLENNSTWKDFIEILTVERDLDLALIKLIPSYIEGVESFKEDFETNGAVFCSEIFWKSFEAEAQAWAEDRYKPVGEIEAIVPEGIYFTGESFLIKDLIPKDEFGIQPIEETKDFNQMLYDANQAVKYSKENIDYILLLIHDNENLTLDKFENADKIITDKEVYIIVINSGTEPSKIPKFDIVEKRFSSKNNIFYASIKYDELYLTLDSLPVNANDKNLGENKFNGNNLLIYSSPI